MIQLSLYAIGLAGPLYVLLFVGVWIARLCFPQAKILFELTEPPLMMASIFLALALAGIIVQIG